MLKYGTFCRKMLKYGTFCREKLDSARWAEKNGKFALRADSTSYPADVALAIGDDAGGGDGGGGRCENDQGS